MTATLGACVLAGGLITGSCRGLSALPGLLAASPPLPDPRPAAWDGPGLRERLPAALRSSAPLPTWPLGQVDLDVARLRLPPVQLERLHRIERAALAASVEATAGLRLDAASRARTAVFLECHTLGRDEARDDIWRFRHHALARRVRAALDELAPAHADPLDRSLRARAPAPALDVDSLLTSAALTAGRVAHALDLGGGHMALDGSPDAPLLALAEAVRALGAGECDLALVLGVSPALGPELVLAHARRGPTWTPLGEGVAALVLAREHAGPLAWIELDADPGVAPWTSGSPGHGGRDLDARLGHLGAAGGLAAVLAAIVDPSGPRTAAGAGGKAARRVRVALAIGGARAGVVPPAEAVSASGTLGTAGVVPSVERDFAPGTPGPAGATSPCERAAAHGTPVDIVGVGAVAPGAGSAEGLWRAVEHGCDPTGAIPRERWTAREVLGPEGAARVASDLAATVSVARPGADTLAVQAAREALAHAGEVSGRVGVVVAALMLEEEDEARVEEGLLLRYLAPLDALCASLGLPATLASAVRARVFAPAPPPTPPLAVRVAAGLGLPAFGRIDAGCASALAAVQCAARRLAMGELDTAVVVATSSHLSPEYYLSLSLFAALSSAGRPPYDRKADGFVPAEAAGALVLRRAGESAASLARVCGIGGASDGRTASPLAPTTPGQLRAIRRAFARAGVTVDALTHLEGHGAGTPLADDTELTTYHALLAGRTASHVVGLGAVKSAVGHSTAAGGALSLVVAALAQARGRTPASGRADEPDPRVTGGPLQLARVSRPLAGLVGVSSFGLGGVSYHALVGPSDARPRAPELPLPLAGATADRFVLSLARAPLPERAPLRSLARRRVVVLGSDDDPLVAALAAAARAHGAEVLAVAPAPASPPCGADVLLDVAPPGRGPLTPRAQALVQDRLRWLAASYDAWEAGGDGWRGYAVVTRLGGDLGLTGAAGSDVLGAALHGLARGVKQELPGVDVKAIDLAADERPEAAAAWVLAELLDGNARLDVGRRAGERVVVVPRLDRLAMPRPHAPPPDHGPPRALGPGQVIVFAGGGRGVGFACALALARRGPTVIVSGRAPAPGPEDIWATWPAERFEAWRFEAYREARRREPSLTPAAFDERFTRMRRQRELAENLARAAASGLDVRYEVVDTTEPAAVRAWIDGLRRRHGRIDGVVHVAMVEWSASIPRKQPARVDATIAAKVGTLEALIAAFAGAPPSWLVAFGSGAGPLGNRGQSDYCAANALLAARVAQLAHEWPGTRTATIDWTAWAEVGALGDPAVREMVRGTGVSSVSTDEGTAWFLQELLLGTAQESLICQERVLRRWHGRDEGRDAPLAVDALGAPLDRGAWPLVDRVVRSDARSLVASRRLDPRTDPFLAQHTLHGAPVPPAAFGCELLAEVAALVRPGWYVEAVEAMEVGASARLVGGRPLELELAAELVAADADACTLHATTRSPLRVRERVLLEAREHHAARVRLVRTPPAPRTVALPPVTGLRLPRSCFHGGNPPVGLGPLFCPVVDVVVGDGVVLATVAADRSADALARTTAPIWQVDPLLLDAAFQSAANLDGVLRRIVSIPVGVGVVRPGARPRAPGERAHVFARLVEEAPPVLVFDIDVTGEDGTLLLEVGRLRMHRVDSP